ncbi:MAG: FtsL-like putative cell division protein [Flavobacteriales bacterium]
MNKLRDKIEEAPEAPVRTASKGKAKAARMPRGLVSVLNGSILTRDNVLRNMSFILFCAGLMIVYIAYGYHTERIVRELNGTDAELKELRSEYITVRSRLEKTEQQSQVAAGIGELGLRESRVPPVKLEVRKKELDKTRTP